MRAVILCGGQGTRLREISEILPKPMITIGNRPILWHIMKLFASQGVSDFILCLGYKGWLIKEFFLNYNMMTSDFTIQLGNNQKPTFHERNDENGWNITLADTGEKTMTGGRLVKIRQYLEGTDHFFLTYGDGVANVDLKNLLHTHINSGKVGTITAVKVAERFGEVHIDNGRVVEFNEKPAVSNNRVNGGFMVFDSKRVWDYFDSDSDNIVLEEKPLREMVKNKQLGVYNHDGFWQCMDTPREYNLLNSIWENGNAAWKIWG
ncbi:MAG: glucose-1-phosphate cytidylyltransferase [Candidatus Latescibacteria bacterium]|nr:glucose-1-phosphate cytidylyltransferase [Candidatus Latescibacterota bacterium]